MPTVGSLEFQRKFGEFQHQAQREPVEITRHGRREFVLMSADHYDWLRAAAQRTHRTADAADVVIDAVERAEMDPEHAHVWLNENNLLAGVKLLLGVDPKQAYEDKTGDIKIA